jgi:hypothetical protein
VPIDVERTGVDHPIALEIFGPKRQTLVALPENSAFAGVINENESLLARASRRRNEVRFDAIPAKFLAM